MQWKVGVGTKSLILLTAPIPEAIFLDNLSMSVCRRYCVSRKICGILFLRTCDYFCVLRELIFAIRTDLFFLLGINFCHFC